MAAEIAAEVMRAGGNVVDAGVSAAIALCVLHCEQVQLGGIAPMILRQAGQVHVLDGVGRWPAACNPALFLTEHRGRIPLGILRSVVPAAPAAWIEALRRFGSFGLAQCAAPAARLAAEGFAVHDEMVTMVTGLRRSFAAWPENAAIWLPGGQPPLPGAWLRLPALAATLQALIDADRGGRRSRGEAGRLEGLAAAEALFYRGEIARQMIDHVEAEGGWLSMADLAAHRCRVEAAVPIPVWDGMLLSCGPWSQGPALGLGLALHARGGQMAEALRVHHLSASLDLALADREAWFGDPEAVTVPMDALADPAHLDARARMIDPDRAFDALPAPSFAPGAAGAESAEADPGGRDTSVVTVCDDQGNAFAATPSDAAYDAPMVPALGFVISTRGVQSHCSPGHPAAVAPLRRPRVTPAPLLYLGRDGRILAAGGPGGDRQLQAMAQVLARHLGTGMPLEAAISAPRVYSQNAPQSSSPHMRANGRLLFEAALEPEVQSALTARGYKLAEVDPKGLGMPSVCLAGMGPRGLEAHGDPRRLSGQIIEARR